MENHFENQDIEFTINLDRALEKLEIFLNNCLILNYITLYEYLIGMKLIENGSITDKRELIFKIKNQNKNNMEKIEIGDIVYFKTGNIPMTVLKIKPNNGYITIVDVVFTVNEIQTWDSVYITTLTKIKPN